jgi:hypothetical protein
MSSVTSSSNTAPYAAQDPFAQIRKDMQALQSALNSKDVSGAQKDMASFSSDLTSLLQNAPGSQTQQTTTDLQALQNALSTSDLAGAQKDLAKLQQDLPGILGERKHHGHHHHSDGDADDAGASGTTSTNGTGSNGTSPSVLYSMLAAYGRGANTGLSGSVNTTA